MSGLVDAYRGGLESDAVPLWQEAVKIGSAHTCRVAATKLEFGYASSIR